MGTVKLRDVQIRARSYQHRQLHVGCVSKHSESPVFTAFIGVADPSVMPHEYFLGNVSSLELNLQPSSGFDSWICAAD